ncbi:MAG: galactokinase [Ruminococcus sp.]|nr:galactokinase [Ruminococcus sp.]
MKLNEIKNSEKFSRNLARLYGFCEDRLTYQRERYQKALDRFFEIFKGADDAEIFSAPGRTEIGGNHTDHQRGCALAAAVDLDIIAVVSFNDDGVIRVYSEGYGFSEVGLGELSARDDEKGGFTALIRGVASRFFDMGVRVGGIDMYCTSDVLSGSGLSSSAAFETLLCAVINTKYNGGKADPIQMAKIGRYTENVYFGKGSGLLDQLACAVGGLAFIDFKDEEAPYVKKIDFDFDSAGYDLCITDTKGSHADLTDDYIAVPEEMKAVARYFGKEVLREVDEESFYKAIPNLYGVCSDRAILRAVHFFKENKRAFLEAKALEENDIERFLSLYRQSARSSSELLQNLYSTKKPESQGIPLAIMMSRLALGDDAAVRVHGGGFAGTV